MQLHPCLARPADAHDVQCPFKATPPTPFCAEHHEEYLALNERKAASTRESDRLRTVVEDMIAEGTGGYTRARDVRRDIAVVRAYVESLRDAIETSVVLVDRFYADGEFDGLQVGIGGKLME